VINGGGYDVLSGMAVSGQSPGKINPVHEASAQKGA
jgi:hypothetical protein